MAWLLWFMSEWGRELVSCVPHLSPRVPGIWGGVTCDPDADRRAFLRSMARVGGHAAVDTLIFMPYLREEQHRAGGKWQGCAVFYPVDLRGRLSRDGTGQGHRPTRSDCSTFRLNQQLNALWRHRLWVGMGMTSIRTPGSQPDDPGIDPCLPESQTGPSLPTHP